MKEKQTGELITEGKKLRENKALKSVIHQTYQRILHQSKNLTRNLENLKLIIEKKTGKKRQVESKGNIFGK